MKLLLTRHGQTDWNLTGKLQGCHDISLNATGIAQARELAHSLKQDGHRIRKVYTSTKKRAMETGQIVANFFQIPWESLEGIEEMNFGEWEGHTWSQIEELYPDNFAMWNRHRRDTIAGGGESCQMVLDRTLVALKQLVERETQLDDNRNGNKDMDEDNEILVIAHGAVLMVLQCYMKKVPMEQMWDYLPKNGAYIECELTSAKMASMSEDT